VLKEFHSAAAGEGNREFWLKLYKAEEQCAKSDAVTGWIVKFFPYTLNGVNGYRKNEWLKTDWQEVRHEGPEMGYFPRGLSKVQFKYIHDKKETPMELLAGFVAIEQKIDLSLRPAIGWMVRESGNGASEIEQQQALIRDRERLKKVIEKKLGENCEVYSYDRHIVIKLNNFRKLDPDSRNNNGKNKISIYLTIKPALPPEECPKRDLLHYKFMKEIARYYKQEKNDEDIKADEYKILIIDDEFSPSEEIEKHRLPSFRWENYEINVQEGYYYKPGEENALDGAIADDEEGRKRLLAIRELFTPYVPAADEKPKK
jgi:hypothetical protein